MAHHTFTILMTPQLDGGYVVSVPALPEIVTEGDTEEEALEMAKEAIQLAVEHRIAKGEILPPDFAGQISKITISVAA